MRIANNLQTHRCKITACSACSMHFVLAIRQSLISEVDSITLQPEPFFFHSTGCSTPVSYSHEICTVRYASSKDIFGGDCSRIARIRTVLDEVVLSEMNCQDQRVLTLDFDVHGLWRFQCLHCSLSTGTFNWLCQVRTCTEACVTWQQTDAVSFHRST